MLTSISSDYFPNIIESLEFSETFPNPPNTVTISNF